MMEGKGKGQVVATKGKSQPRKKSVSKSIQKLAGLHPSPLLKICISRTCDNKVSKKPGRAWMCDECAERMEAHVQSVKTKAPAKSRRRHKPKGRRMVLRRGDS